ncbi:hypothetical protein D3C80_1604600 [compost metagenome]
MVVDIVCSLLQSSEHRFNGIRIFLKEIVSDLNSGMHAHPVDITRVVGKLTFCPAEQELASALNPFSNKRLPCRYRIHIAFFQSDNSV